MRIGLLIYGSLETISGGNIYDRHLVDHLREHGDQVEIISIPWRARYPVTMLDNFSHRLHAQLANLEVDCLIQDELCHPSLCWLNWRIKKRVSYPVISLVHHLRSSEEHPAWIKPLYRTIEKTYLQSVDGFIFNSHTTMESVRKYVPNLPPYVTAYPGGDGLGDTIAADEIRLRANQKRPIRILFLGSLTRRKGLHILLDACEQLEPGTYELTIIGSQHAEARYARRMLKRIAQMKRTNHIQVLVTQPTDALTALLKAQDILVVPSSYEGFGIVYLEGMGFGLPAIASTAGAACETIKHGENGYLIAPNDSLALAQHLRQLSSKREELLRLSLNARNTHLQGPTWEGMGERVRQYLLSNI